MIYGIGTDIVDVDRIRESMERTPLFLTNTFSQVEIDYCMRAEGDLKYQRFAVRFAAKEAFLKACGTNFFEKCGLNQISVVHKLHNKPEIKLSGKAAEIFNKEIGGTIHASLSHTSKFAQATVIMERK